jgi:hypothetical protein
MSFVNHKGITKILEDSMATYEWGKGRAIWDKQSIQVVCYEWLEQAYPEIFNEFKAVYDVQRED